MVAADQGRSPADGSPLEQRLGAGNIDEALVLSGAAHWNQGAADWRLFIEHGTVWGLRMRGGSDDGRLVASAAILPYGERFGWVSMVLVLPEFRGRGYATRLVHRALDALRSDGRAALLDATPDGRPVYSREGFADSWGFARWRREPGPAPGAAPGASVRPVSASDWAAILAQDLPVFGADRGWLLRALHARQPALAHVHRRAGGGGIDGYVFGRDGREATQLGPVIARDPAAAIRLIRAALAQVPGAAYLDLTDRHRVLVPELETLGFVHQRPFTRMVLDAATAPGAADDLVAVAGPELG
ncbi:MAG: GNAT family N-acetyltransferase [Burkholderiales bacterium]|nr:MAG: GNAT family N-acetyltransferase [Burkholderiales bacterium]